MPLIQVHVIKGQGDDHRRRPRSGTRQSCMTARPRVAPSCARTINMVRVPARPNVPTLTKPNQQRGETETFDDFVGFRDEHRRHAGVERLDGLQIDDQLELGPLLGR